MEENCLLFDYIYIDADHSYESVKADIETWLPFVKPSGIIAGHDYSAHFTGVVTAVNEFFDNNSDVLTPIPIRIQTLCPGYLCIKDNIPLVFADEWAFIRK